MQPVINFIAVTASASGSLRRTFSFVTQWPRITSESRPIRANIYGYYLNFNDTPPAYASVLASDRSDKRHSSDSRETAARSHDGLKEEGRKKRREKQKRNRNGSRSRLIRATTPSRATASRFLSFCRERRIGRRFNGRRRSIRADEAAESVPCRPLPASPPRLVYPFNTSLSNRLLHFAARCSCDIVPRLSHALPRRDASHSAAPARVAEDRSSRDSIVETRTRTEGGSIWDYLVAARGFRGGAKERGKVIKSASVACNWRGID